MRRSICTIFACLLGFTLNAQEGSDDVGPHHRVRSTIEQVLQPDGTTVLRTNSFVQLEPGLNRLERGEWIPAEESLEIVGDSVLATKTLHRVILAGNAKSRGAVDIELPDGGRLRGHCLGLSYFDAATGESVLIAELKDAIAEVHPPNMVLYPDAFDDVDADLLYVNRKGSFEQFVVLRSPPPSPSDFGLDPRFIRLEVVSEFVDAPVPTKALRFLREETEPTRRAMLVEPDLVDEVIDFGPMFLNDGQAFLPTGEPWKLDAVKEVPMAKSWRVIEGRSLLFEAVEYQSLEPLLATLKAKAKNVAELRKRTKNRQLPARRTASATRTPIQVASAASIPTGVFLDYTLSSGVTNFTFQSDTTYYVTAAINCGGTNTTFEGGTVVKFANTNNAALDLACTNVTWLGSPYRPITLTGSDDCSIGVTVRTNTFTGYYAATALNVKAPLTSVDMAHVRILRAQTAITFNQGYYHAIKHAQLLGCQQGVKLTGSIVRLRNALMSDVKTNFNINGSIMAVEHLTVNGSTLLNTAGTLYLTNSLLVGVGTTNGWTGVSNVFLASASGVFANAAAGSNYLAFGSAYRDVGSTAINSDLQKDLKTMTTVAPTALTGTITTATTLGPSVARDTDIPDLGYHYYPIDYYATTLTVTNATLALTNGVALGFYGSTWIWARAGATLLSEGMPHRLNHLASLLQVQEQPIATYAAGNPAVINLYSTVTNGPTVRLWFTGVHSMAGSLIYSDPTYYPLGSCELRYSSFGATSFYIESYTPTLSVTLMNNLFERQNMTFADSMSLSAYNNLFRNSEAACWNYATNQWVMKDNAFENTFISPYGAISNGYNAYITTNITATGRLMPTNVNDKVLSSFTYSTGSLGRFYHSSTSLLNVGSRSAADAGLYHFTVLTSTNKDTATVDIGYHYVATDANGNPLDVGDGDGIPDYFEDRDGDGNVDSGETNWQDASDLGLRVRITVPQSGTGIP